MKYLVSIMMFAFCLMVLVEPTFAQCPMCKASAERSIAEGSTGALGLNHGILYLLSMPYLLVATIGFFWWKGNRKKTGAQL